MINSRSDKKTPSELIKSPQVRRLMKLLAKFAPIYVKRQYFFRRGHGRFFIGKSSTFSEKLQWRALHDRRKIIAAGGDKISMKQYVQGLNLDIQIPRTLWHGSNLENVLDVDWGCRWVLKPITGSGYAAFGQGTLRDNDHLLREIESWKPLDVYHVKGEWHYSQSRPGFLIEERIPTRDGNSPHDYRFFVFDGKVEFVQVDTPRVEQVQRRFYTADWEPLEVRQGKALLSEVVDMPANYSHLKTLAEKIGEQFDFIRVDLYDADGLVWFGELTPNPAGGVAPFIPTAFDMQLGNLWELPFKKFGRKLK